MTATKKKRGRKPKNKRYFTNITEIAIVAYNSLDPDDPRRNKIYQRFIYRALDKMAENLIHTFKMYYFKIPYEDVKHSVVAFIVEKLHMYKSDKGKAFSYFSRVGKNWLILNNQMAYKERQREAEVDEIDTSRDVLSEVSYTEYQQDLKDYTNLFIEYYDNNLIELFPKRKDMKIADAVIELFRQRELIEKYNKKALYLMIRERTGIESAPDITKVVSSIKTEFMDGFKHFQKTGHFKSLLDNNEFYKFM